MNSFEKFLVEFLIEGGIGSKGSERPGEERIRGHQERATKHYQKIADDPDNPDTSEDEKRDAKQYLERGPRWSSTSDRKKYGRGNKK